MRSEDKDIDARDLEHTELQQRTLIGEFHGGTDLPEFGGEEVRDVDRPSASVLINAMRQIFDKEQLSVPKLRLPDREARALEALQAAVTGRGQTKMFVFAEDRRSLLEQSLAVLQANLTGGSPTELAEISESVGLLSKRVATLREKLSHLEDAQDELLADERARFQAAAETETGDKPAKPVDPDAPRPASILAGPGPAVERTDKPSTLQGGPEAKLEQHPTTLTTGPEIKREDKPTTLTGPEVKEAAKPATSLGDGEEIEKAAKPWWKRPFG